MANDDNKKISTNLPGYLSKQATELTGLNQTEVLIDGLREVVAREQRRQLLNLRGKVHIDLDTNASRRRSKT